MIEFFQFALDGPRQFFGTLCLLFILYAMIIGIIRTIKLREK